MRKTLIITIFFGAQLLFYSCSKDSTTVQEPLLAETFLNVSYGTNSQQKYDLYLPADRSTEKTKLIILVHGGGWTEGDKTDMDFLIPYIKLRHPNHAIVNTNYTLADIDTPAFPNQFLDLESVIEKLTTEKNELHINPEFALIGVSAGAHISLMYDYVYDTKDRVKMVADIVGPTDFTDPFYSNEPNFPILMALLVDESAYPQGANYPEILSPALQVSSLSSPTLLFYGDADPLIPISNAITLQTALNTFQIDHNYTVYSGGHGDWEPKDIEDMTAQISTYIDKYLKIEE